MLQINRVKAIARTGIGNYGFDYNLRPGLNFISSSDNTRGKSSVLVAIYYCLGLEEIIGGKGHKVLTSVYKNSIDDGNNTYGVLESEVFLEINNGCDTITIYRSATMENRSDQLVTVYYNSLDNIEPSNAEDMYVHSHNAATNSKGFHAFLEKFIGLELPMVPANDDKDRKLYLQLIFSCIFIEQKRGWADVFSGMPILGIKEAKKRVIEYILGLDTLKNERKKNELSIREAYIKNEWQKIVEDISSAANKVNFQVIGLPQQPRVLEKYIISPLQIKMRGTEKISVDNKIEELEKEYDGLRVVKPKIVDNFDELQVELDETEKSIEILERRITEARDMLLREEASLRTLSDTLEIVNLDIRNNKDAAKLKRLGSELDYATSKDICPLCNQSIQDSLLPVQYLTNIMSIEENIKHLDSQKQMLEFAIAGHKENKDELKINIDESSASIFTLRRLAKSIRSDLYSINEDLSEAIIYKRINLENKITSLREMKQHVIKQYEKLEALSKEWKTYLEEKSKLPSKKFTELDLDKLTFLQEQFKKNLRKYNYKSVANFNNITISHHTYLPATEGFDMKFDSSASDNIRAIWAFTIAVMQTSLNKGGNLPEVLIFDEPAQHSIITDDMAQFFQSILQFEDKVQVIIGITVKDSETKEIIKELDSDKYYLINVGEKAFKSISVKEH